MTAAFDSEVYAERQRLPGVSICISRLMQHALWSGLPSESGRPAITLGLQYRHDVDSSVWWQLRLGEEIIGEAQSLELCLFRAAVRLRETDQRSKKYAGMPPGNSSQISQE